MAIQGPPLRMLSLGEMTIDPSSVFQVGRTDDRDRWRRGARSLIYYDIKTYHEGRK
jgi:hypothetical protein